MAERIRGQVAALLNSRELVINRGAEHGVSLGMRFAVLNRHGVDITDPETGDKLDPIELEKTIVKVVRVMSRASVARTFRTYSTGSSALALAGFFEPRREVPETLQISGNTAREEMDESESYVKLGDPVVQFFNEEYLDDSTK